MVETHTEIKLFIETSYDSLGEILVDFDEQQKILQ
jgi:hypothetical protein